jgi:hypothetical protein
MKELLGAVMQSPVSFVALVAGLGIAAAGIVVLLLEMFASAAEGSK